MKPKIPNLVVEFDDVNYTLNVGPRRAASDPYGPEWVVPELLAHDLAVVIAQFLGHRATPLMLLRVQTAVYTWLTIRVAMGDLWFDVILRQWRYILGNGQFGPNRRGR